jgi:hypothetical protein
MSETVGKATFGGRLAAADLGVPVQAIVEKGSFRVFIIQNVGDATGGELGVVVPCGKLNPEHVMQVDDYMSRQGLLRVWISPRGDWSSRVTGVPWCPVERDASKRLTASGPPDRSSLPELIKALQSHALTPADVVKWDERDRLQY